MFQESIGSPILWLGFVLFVLAMLAVDLGLFHRKSHEVSLAVIALILGVSVLASLGKRPERTGGDRLAAT
jgi:tellurite resistance protein TerC